MNLQDKLPLYVEGKEGVRGSFEFYLFFYKLGANHIFLIEFPV